MSDETEGKLRECESWNEQLDRRVELLEAAIREFDIEGFASWANVVRKERDSSQLSHAAQKLADKGTKLIAALNPRDG